MSDNKWQFVAGQEHHPLYVYEIAPTYKMYVRFMCPRDRDTEKESKLPLPNATVALYEDNNMVLRKVIAENLPRDIVPNIDDVKGKALEVALDYLSQKNGDMLKAYWEVENKRQRYYEYTRDLCSDYDSLYPQSYNSQDFELEIDGMTITYKDGRKEKV